MRQGFIDKLKVYEDCIDQGWGVSIARQRAFGVNSWAKVRCFNDAERRILNDIACANVKKNNKQEKKRFCFMR